MEVPLQEEREVSAVAEASSADPEVLHQPQVLHLVANDPLVKVG